MAAIIANRIAARNRRFAMQNPSPSRLRLTGVQKRYGAVRALRGVSFDLRAGEVHALVGENGAGKSTLIKVITGAVAPDAGETVLNGTAIAHNSPRVAKE